VSRFFSCQLAASSSLIIQRNSFPFGCFQGEASETMRQRHTIVGSLTPSDSVWRSPCSSVYSCFDISALNFKGK
jgi:hypothetical protein